MSIHVYLSPEAQEALRREQRKSSILSMFIAVLTIVLIGLILGFFLLDAQVRETPTIVTYAATLPEETQIEERKVTTQMMRQPTSPASSHAKVIAAATSSPTAIPVPDLDISTPSTMFGDTDDFGFGFGDSVGATGGFAGIPSVMRKRCSPEDRAQRLAESGGTPEVETAIEKSLQWLQSTQNANGSWGGSNTGAMTGFALLTYLGRCETPMSPEYGANVLNGILYLINLAEKNDGRLASSGASGNAWVYEHGIATYALAEAYTFCKQLGIHVPQLAETTRKAGDMIVNGQGPNGGWLYRYSRGRGGDNSVGFWQIQAIKASQYTGLWEAGELDKTLRNAIDWLKSVQGENGAIGYRQASSRSPGLTGGGVLCIQLVEGPQSSAARRGIAYLRDNSHFRFEDSSANLYYHYYNAQAMINHGGSEWQDYNAKFRDTLLENQSSKGTWIRRHGNHDAINEHMATCLATMMLQVYYRFLPATGESIRGR